MPSISGAKYHLQIATVGQNPQTIQHLVTEFQNRAYKGDFVDLLAVTNEQKLYL